MNGGIAARMADHYTRQIAWVEASLAALDAMAAMPIDSDWDAVVVEDAKRAADLKLLEAEYYALKKEWDATPAFLPGERNHVRELSERFEALAAEFQKKLEGLAKRFSEAGASAKEELGTLRKARDVLQTVATGSTGSGGFVDRRA